MMRTLACLTAVLILAIADAAVADLIQVTYRLLPAEPNNSENSQFRLEHPIQILNMAPITGTAVITFTGDGSGNIAPDGRVRLDSLVFDVDFGAAGFPSSIFGMNGVLSVALASPVRGNLVNDPAIADFPVPVEISGTIECPAPCFLDLIGMPPSNTLNVTTGEGLSVAPVTDAPSTFFAVLSLSINLTPDRPDPLNGPQVASLFGEETSRTILPIPEPGTLLLLGSGVVGLAMVGTRRRLVSCRDVLSKCCSA